MSGEVSGCVVYSPPEPPDPRTLSCSVNTWEFKMTKGKQKERETTKNKIYLSSDLLHEGGTTHDSLPAIVIMIRFLRIRVQRNYVFQICRHHGMQIYHLRKSGI